MERSWRGINGRQREKVKEKREVGRKMNRRSSAEENVRRRSGSAGHVAAYAKAKTLLPDAGQNQH